MTLLKEYEADCELRGLASREVYVLYAREFCRFLEMRGKDPSQVDRADLKAYLQAIKSRGLKPTSQTRVFASIGAFYEFLVDEGVLEINPVRAFRRRYIRPYKENCGSDPKQLISVEQAAMLVNSILITRDKALLVLLFKTGMRLGELCSLDVGDIDLIDMSLTLTPTAKRSNRLLFFDHETARILQTWMVIRPDREKLGPSSPLFLSKKGVRLCHQRVQEIVQQHAARVGLHDALSKSPARRFTPHCARHFFTTHLMRAGMAREYIKWLRGDALNEAIDIYHHIDADDVRRAYMACVPQMGI